VLSLMRQLAKHRELSHVRVEKPGFRLELRRHTPAPEPGAPS
jgi:hypothetical protein